MKKILTALLLTCLCCLLPAGASAEAECLSGTAAVAGFAGFYWYGGLFDGYYTDGVNFSNGAYLRMTHEKGFGSLYLMFDDEYGIFTVTDNSSGRTESFGENHFYNEYADLEAAFGTAPTDITLTLPSGNGSLVEVIPYSPGPVPENVQKWELPADGNADIVLFSTHCDDEQLFLGGIVPYYAAQGKTVQLVYFSDHRNQTKRRTREALEGLWGVGCRHYPVFGSYPDYQTDSAGSMKISLNYHGFSMEQMTGYVVENLRRFRPLAAVGHDVNGEYGHPQHIVYSELLRAAAEISGSPDAYPESALKWGVWDVPKTYLHLYPENRILLDLDAPLDAFGGLSAFQVTKMKGFPAHVSQQEYYRWYMDGKNTAADITIYSPREYGLLRSLVGTDTRCDDFLENLDNWRREHS